MIAHVIGWVVVAPVLDILIYAEPANKVFAQGVFAAVSNSITGVIVGGLLVLAYTKTIAKKGSLDQEYDMELLFTGVHAEVDSVGKAFSCSLYGLWKGFFYC